MVEKLKFNKILILEDLKIDYSFYSEQPLKVNTERSNLPTTRNNFTHCSFANQ